MNNRGQTTVLFSLIMSALFLFTLSAFEVERIHLSKVKIKAVVHSTCSSVMADYNSGLFERYHLLFMDSTYGTGSEAVLEEKIADYLEQSLNGRDKNSGKLYRFTVEEIALAEEKRILDEGMKRLKQQIAEHEKITGFVNRAKELAEDIKENKSDINNAVKETEQNGTKLPGKKEEPAKTDEEKESAVKVKDPRDTLSKALQSGTLAFVLPEGYSVSKEAFDTTDLPSAAYERQEEEEAALSFRKLNPFKKYLQKSAAEDNASTLKTKAAFADYVCRYFSHGVKELENCAQRCEVEYILKGKNNDYDNLEAVTEEIIRMRLPVNYAYLLTDSEKKSEALTMSAAICAMTGTEPMIEVVKYLLLGCWAYGETLCEMNILLSGEKIAYGKTKDGWMTGLKTLHKKQAVKGVEQGMDYEAYLMLLLAKRSGEKSDACYARMLDIIERNLQLEDKDFHIVNCVDELTIQGKIRLEPLYGKKQSEEYYEYYIEEKIDYD
ncbi:MAG: DUF5702 domain-containing protein [Bacteroidales bacterium]|nr:DUF5702 domain-containing protein [Clostridium sp.]MCM1204624.1 DUF5702 domain-containing protein [Bacteroidales bacterium]